jgi:hypothetical protein
VLAVRDSPPYSLPRATTTLQYRVHVGSSGKYILQYSRYHKCFVLYIYIIVALCGFIICTSDRPCFGRVMARVCLTCNAAHQRLKAGSNWQVCSLRNHGTRSASPLPLTQLHSISISLWAMDLDELEILLRKQAHTEEEYAKIIGSCRFTRLSVEDHLATLERSGLIDLRVPPGSADFEPPLSALIYAAQGILHPTLSFNHIPDLLDILSQVERAREFSREHAKWALIWQRFYETRPNPNVRVLQKSDKDVLKKVLKPERLDATRRIFICIVEHVIRMVRILFVFS